MIAGILGSIKQVSCNSEAECTGVIELPDYKDQSAQSKIVISAGIAEIQMPWMASAEHILVVWIPAIPAGKTLLLKHLYNQVELLLFGPISFEMNGVFGGSAIIVGTAFYGFQRNEAG